MKKPVLIVAIVAAITGTILYVQSRPTAPVVTIYSSVDQVYSEPVLRTFEAQTGITVKALYDAEASKTVGLVNRLIVEKSAPLADVFWNGEFSQTLVLHEAGVLAPYTSPSTVDLPAWLVDSDGYWAGFGGRARVIIVNTDLVAPANRPDSLLDLANRPSEVTFANPLFGSTSTHVAALGAVLGPDDAVQFFARLKAGGARMVDGNAVVRNMVAEGRVPLGLTDTDDACVALSDGAPVAVVFPDQGEREMGTLVIANTVALIADAPNPDAARQLIDYLLSPETEAALIESGWVQIPARPSLAVPKCYGGLELRTMQVTMPEIRAAGAKTGPRLRALFQN